MQYEHSSLRDSQKTWWKALISWHLVISPTNPLHRSGICVEITLEVGVKLGEIFGNPKIEIHKEVPLVLAESQG